MNRYELTEQEKNEIKTQMEQRAARIEWVAAAYLPDREGLQETVLDAMHYSVMAGGKRLRPMLMEAASDACGGADGNVLEPFMAAIEMIHTYSLVHDDLPAMDNDEYRRGKKTTHAVYGEAMGILAGDALLNYAYETAAKALKYSKDKETAIRAFQVLVSKAGVFGMVGGQVVDVEGEKHGIHMTRERLDFIYRLKTSALIECSLMIGAILAEADDAVVEALEKAGTALGMAFQIRDDILDVTSTLEELGKPVGSDAKNEKVTYVTFEGMEKAEEDVNRLTGQAIELLSACEGDTRFLKNLFLYLIDRRN